MSAQGLNLAWNESAGNGESEFVNQYQSGGIGGFNWSNTATTSSHGSPIMTLSGLTPATAVLTVASLVGNTSGTHTGAVVGNASTATTASALASTSPCGSGFATGINTSGTATGCGTNIATATALAATPSQCSTGWFSTGVTANGAPNCTPVFTQANTGWAGGSTCTTSSSAGTTCTATATFNHTQTSINYSVGCTGVSPSGFPSIMGVTKSTSSVTITVQNGQGSQGVASGYSEIDCIVMPAIPSI